MFENNGTIASGAYFNQATTLNRGTIRLAEGSFLNESGLVDNAGVIRLNNGHFINEALTSNLQGALLAVDTGRIENRSGTINNHGEIRLTLGDYLNASGANTSNIGTLGLTRGNFQNSSNATLTNEGTLTLSHGRFVNSGTTENTGGEIALTRGNFENQTGAKFRNTGSLDLLQGSYVNQGTTNNQSGGRIDITAGNFENQAGTVTNDGRITSANGKFINRSTTTNRGEISLASGNFEHQTGTVTNEGEIRLRHGDFLSRGTVFGDGRLAVSGDATFFPGSRLEGNPTIVANTLSLQGYVVPGGSGTLGQMVFNADTRFQGVTSLDLSPGVGNDSIQILAGQTGTLESGAQFDFHMTTPASIGDTYTIIRGNVALDERPWATDNLDNRRVILRTDRDVTGFQGAGRAYYALIARDESFGQLGRNNGGSGNQVTFADYLDIATALDDGALGPGGDLQWVRDTLDLMPNKADVVDALGQMNGEIYAPLNTLSLQRQFIAYQHLVRHVRPDPFLTQGCESLEECRLPIHGWVSAVGSGGSISGDANARGGTHGGGGLQVGFGYLPEEWLGLGPPIGFGAFYDFGTFDLSHDGGDRANIATHS